MNIRKWAEKHDIQIKGKLIRIKDDKAFGCRVWIDEGEAEFAVYPDRIIYSAAFPDGSNDLFDDYYD